MSSRFVPLAVTIVLVHLAINLAHGWAHLTIPVANTVPARAVFRGSALALALSELAGVVIGAWGARVTRGFAAHADRAAPPVVGR